MEDLMGKRLDGRYEITELIGEGGMANVFKARDLKEDRIVAVKIMKEEFTDNEELVRRFRNESRAISVLGHPNIIKVYDVSVNPKLQYMVMELVDGITLKEYIEQRGEPLTYKEVVHIIPQVLKALQHAHDKGVVHRDIKPQNIMIQEDGSIRVMDFGIARLARSEIHTQGEQTIGSVHYISPEQAQGAQTDPRADLYSTGIMMYEMLSGRLPFESDNAVSIAIKQISDEAIPIKEINPSVPDGLVEITMRAMAKDPKKRYRRAMDMLHDIESFKKNPQIHFEYEYLLQDSPARTIDKVVNQTKNSSAQSKAKRKKKKRLKLLMPIALGITFSVVVATFVICWSILQNSGNALFTEVEDIELPDFVGMTLDEATKMLKQSKYSGLRTEFEYEYNESTVPGTIIQQVPSPNKLVKSNQMLILTVSKEVEQIEMPDLIGMDKEEARKIISDYGMLPYIRPVNNSEVAAGTVFDTSPAPGTLVAQMPDTQINIYVAANFADYDRTVPNLVNMASAQEASTALSAVDLTLGKVEEEYSDLPVGTVIRQNPDPGSTRKAGQSVSIWVSIGPEYIPPPEDIHQVPGVVKYSSADAQVLLNSNGFEMVIGGEEYSETVPKGSVVRQSVEQGTLVDFNNGGSRQVTVWLSLGPQATPTPTPTPQATPPPEPAPPPADGG